MWFERFRIEFNKSPYLQLPDPVSLPKTSEASFSPQVVGRLDTTSAPFSPELSTSCHLESLRVIFRTPPWAAGVRTVNDHIGDSPSTHPRVLRNSAVVDSERSGGRNQEFSDYLDLQSPQNNVLYTQKQKVYLDPPNVPLIVSIRWYLGYLKG